MGCDRPAVFQLEAAEQCHHRRHPQPLCQRIWPKVPYSKPKSYFLQIFRAFKQISHLALTLIQQYAVLIKQYDENKGCCAQIWRSSTRLKRVSSFYAGFLRTFTYQGTLETQREKRLYGISKTFHHSPTLLLSQPRRIH